MPLSPELLSLKTARRIALTAQGFSRRRPTDQVTARDLQRVIGRIGLLQIDSVNVLARAHYLPLFSRLGPYPRTLLDQAAWGKPRRLFEYWAHEASLLPLALHPLLRWRMARAERGEGVWGHLRSFAGERRAEADAILRRIEDEGPLAASDLGAPRGAGGWWGWSEAKRTIEWLFWAGLLTTAARRAGFERVYDLPERVLPRDILAAPTPAPEDAHRELLRLSARALGVATASDLRDYFRLKPADAAPRLKELVEAGLLLPARVEGWSQPAYLDPQAVASRRLQPHALLAPFDPLIWDRARTERLFGVRVRLEIYTPAHKRTLGYYVLPFLKGQQIAARVDLKADRTAGILRVLAAHGEANAPPDTPIALAEELTAMAGWLGLDRVTSEPRGDLAPTLAVALGG